MQTDLKTSFRFGSFLFKVKTEQSEQTIGYDRILCGHLMSAEPAMQRMKLSCCTNKYHVPLTFIFLSIDNETRIFNGN